MKINIQFDMTPGGRKPSMVIDLSRVPCIGENVYYSNSGDDVFYEVVEVYHRIDDITHSACADIRVRTHNERF